MKFKTYKYILIPGMLCSAVSGSFAQTSPAPGENPTKLDINIKTPNVASLERYGNIPVSMYTGVPQINIPLHTITVGRHSLPISASYHASGIRVKDRSGDIGTGWSLSAGYNISRTLRGLPDESPNGYLGDGGIQYRPSNYTISTNETRDSFKSAADGIKDIQPDEFNFNIGTASGKFILDKNHKVIVIPDQDIKVDFVTAPATGTFDFTLTDAYGTRYYFNEAINTTSIVCGDDPGNSYYSTWYISKIDFPNNSSEITFNYITATQTLSDLSQEISYDFKNGTLSPAQYRNCEQYSTIPEKKISAINFPDGILTFNYNTLKYDIPNTYALSNFQVRDKQNVVLKEAQFVYGYYNTNASNSLAKKLRLDSVVLSDNTNDKISYGMTYNGNDIPSFDAKSQDIWGYYNGANNNSSLVPGGMYTLTGFQGVPFEVPGGDRKVNPLYTSKGVLTRLTFPTGGYTEFEYENNKVGFDCHEAPINDSVFNNITEQVYANCMGNQSPYQATQTSDFSVTRSQNITVFIEKNENACTGTIVNFFLKDLSTGQIITQGNTSTTNIQLTAGHNYRLSATANCENAEANMLTCNQWIKARISHAEYGGTVNKYRYAGGLRVKQVTDFEPVSNSSTIKQYIYTTPFDPARPSGISLLEPKFDYIFYTDFNIGQSGSHSYYVPGSVFKFGSQFNNTTQGAGASVAYKYVKENIGAQSEGGYNLHTFSIPYVSCELSFPFAPVTDYSPRNGLLLNTETYNSSGVLVQKTGNSYSYVFNDEIPGWKAAYYKRGTVCLFCSGGTESVFAGYAYKYISEKIRKDSTVVTDYFNGNTISQSTVNLYAPSAYYPYQTRTSGSSGEVVSTTMARAADFSVTAGGNLSGMAQALKYMKENHLNDYPVEAITETNGQVTGGYINEYGLFSFSGKDLILPVQIYALNNTDVVNNYSPVAQTINTNTTNLTKDNRYTLEAAYSGFNAYGNPGRVTAKGDQNSAMLWGYEGRYLVAKLEHIDPAALQTYLTANPSLQQSLDNPASDAALRNTVQQLRTAFPEAMISGYTCKPSVGITSMTDANNRVAYYEYDSLGRLLRIKDQNGNLLKTFEYQYQSNN